MEIKSTDSSSRLNQDQQEAGLNTTGELNLYFDLLAFSELSPEEQLADRERLKDASYNQVLETGIEFPGFVEAAGTFDGVVASDEASEHALESLLAVEQPEHEQREHEQPACDPFALLEPTAEMDPVFEFLPVAEQVATIKPNDAPLQVQTTEPPAAPVEMNNLFRASGPLSLSGFLFDPTSKAAAQVMRIAVCATCGTESDGEDLFCAACGTFMDEATVNEPVGLACDDCGLIIATDELICPSCGLVSAV
jgi:hypothetical protein